MPQKRRLFIKALALRPSMDWQDGGWIHTREGESIEETHSNGTSKSKNDDATPLISLQESPSNTHVLDGTEDDLMNDAPTPTITTRESSSSTLVLESNEDDMMNGYATEIITPEESYSNTTVLEATENENQIPEPVVELELPLSHESGDTMNDDAASPIIDPQEIPIDGTEDDLMNDAPTPTIATQESISSTLVLESNEDDMLNGYATEIINPEESYNDTMNDDASSPIINAQEIPIANTYQVDVKCILGDPEMHKDLVEDVDIQFGRVVDIVKRGYRLKRQDWINGSVNIAVAEAEIEKNNYGPGIDATDKEKNEFLNKQVEMLKERVEYLENLLNIRRETEKVQTLEGQQVDDDTEVSGKESCEVEVYPREEGFQGSWFRDILEQDPAKVKGEKLRVRYTTLFNEGGANPCREYIERCFIMPVPPECLNEGVKFKEGSVVDTYYSDGWWNGVIVVEEEDGSFLVYFDDPPDILKFDKNQLRPHAHWTGFKWVTRKNKHREVGGSDPPSPPRDLFEKYELQDIVEVFVGYGWRKGEVKEILLDDQYKVSFNDTEEWTVFENHNIRRLMEWEDGVWIHPHMREFEKEANTNVATPAITSQVSNISTTYVLETNDDDMMSDAPTEITIPQETANNTHDMDDGTTKDIEPPNITPWDFCQETPIAEVVKNNDDHGIDATDKDKIEFLTKQVNTLKERVTYLEDLLDIRQETEKKQETENQTQDETKQQVEPDVEVKDSVQLQRNKRERVNKEQSQDEDQQMEDDAEVDDSDKERETSKNNEGRTHNEEEQREEGDVEVEKTVQAQRKKRGRGKKSQTHEEKEQQEESVAAVEKSVEGENKKQGRPRRAKHMRKKNSKRKLMLKSRSPWKRAVTGTSKSKKTKDTRWKRFN
ncbi:hypothetical protein Bca4012_084124 [Brassica carinata]